MDVNRSRAYATLHRRRERRPGQKSLLVMAYFFPPVAGVGVERTLKHVTYLPDAGWHTVVVAPATPGYRLLDPASLERIPHSVETIRVRAPEPAHLRHLLRRLAGRANRAPSAVDDRRPATLSRTESDRSLKDLANSAWAHLVPLVFFPDEQELWAAAAAVAALRVHRRKSVDAIYSSSAPVSAHLAAGTVKRLTGLPWIADFRDPWIGNAFAPQLGPVRRRLRAHLERWIVRTADRTVVATEGMRTMLVDRYPQLATRFVVIPNGYDLAELENLSELTDAAPPGSRAPDSAAPDRTLFRLVYTGSIHLERELPILLDGVELLIARQPALRDPLRVELVGWLSEANREIAARRLPALDPVVRHLGFEPRLEALRRVRSADAGLVLLADGPGRDAVVGAKIYDYLGLDVPVLAVTPPGELRRILHDLDWGVIADPTPEGVADGLAELMRRPRPERRADPERRYERRRLAAQLGALLDTIVGESIATARREDADAAPAGRGLPADE